MMKKHAFTMIELIFVIIVIGIIGKFGTEFLAQAYKNFISTSIHNQYQNQSSTALELIAKRLQYRIKNSVIEKNQVTKTFNLLENAPLSNNDVLEWIGYDSDGLRSGAWSGVFSKSASGTELVSPESNTTAINDNIAALSHGNSGINRAAIYFIGSDSEVNSWGWDGTLPNQFDDVHPMKPIKIGSAVENFESDVSGKNFNDIDLNKNQYNSYQLAWTAYAVVFDKNNQKLWLYSDYQPWEGDTYDDAKQKFLIMEEVSDFKKKQRKGIITIKVCSINTKLKDLDEGEFLTCKEKTIL